MTFNLRYASTSRPNSWAERRPVMRDLLRKERPDILGTQEGLYSQLQDIEKDLPGNDYRMIGVGREGGSRGEFMAVFYNTDRLQPLEFDHFWLSDTPNVIGSNTWGGGSIRMVTWVRFLDKVTNQQFFALNTHLDNSSENARRRAASLIDQRVRALNPALPKIVTGDFNTAAGAGSVPYSTLVTNGVLQDTWVNAAERSPVYGTFHNYRPLTPNGARIDWILASAGVTTRAVAINTFSKGGQFPSDHLPVEAVVKLPAPAAS
ncbi:endonuclease/exonuclease/phosphatase family protein [Motilibacter sp. E257]|uniref:Endonuclease/exonuclease/phosphatase family protein n=2 Tax=Motilibacter deserti TaxID=2714956 RepID=A0ABX0GQK8_9ACTN|nr:endonuclease/exonuclease/phosphatase family protein [Motilibacter deserti]NHC12758.1 endonuclease/exonuclease/phosphatase family protein [Motilibacter deserti]